MSFPSSTEASDNGSLSLAVLEWRKDWINLVELDLSETIYAYGLLPTEFILYAIILTCIKQKNVDNTHWSLSAFTPFAKTLFSECGGTVKKELERIQGN